MSEIEKKVLEILKKTRVEVAPDSYTLVSLTHANWNKLLETPELSPRMTAPFMIFQDNLEVTLLLDEIDYEKIHYAILTAKTESGFRLLTFDVELDFTVVGFVAFVAKILAEAGISIVTLSAFSRDHLLIKQNDLAKALVILGAYVEELC